MAKTEKKKKVYRKINFDLAPLLDGKTVIIPDMAQILKLHPNEKAAVWAQLRELYDGRAGKKTGSLEGIGKHYENLRVTLIACSTPAIDSQILIHQDLGTRELLFRTTTEKDAGEDKTDLMQKVWENEELEDFMRIELKEVVAKFFDGRKIQEIMISEQVKKEIEAYVDILRFLRASAEIDSFSGELIGVVYPEQPTRALKQLKRMYICLKSLDKDYPDERALSVIRHIVLSSCSYNRIRVLAALVELLSELEKMNTVTVSKIAQHIKLGTKTVYRELNTLWNMGIIERKLEYKQYYGKEQEVQLWTFQNTDLVKNVIKIFKSSYTPENKYSYISNTCLNLKENIPNIHNTTKQPVYSDTPESKQPDISNEKEITSHFSEQELKKILEEFA